MTYDGVRFENYSELPTPLFDMYQVTSNEAKAFSFMAVNYIFKGFTYDLLTPVLNKGKET